MDDCVCIVQGVDQKGMVFGFFKRRARELRVDSKQILAFWLKGVLWSEWVSRRGGGHKAKGLVKVCGRVLEVLSYFFGVAQVEVQRRVAVFLVVFKEAFH